MAADEVLELDQSFYDVEDDSAEALDFDAWWAARDRPTATIAGMAVPVPDQVPARVLKDPSAVLAMSTDDVDGMMALLAEVLDLAGADGQDLVDQLLEALGSHQLPIVFLWAIVNAMRPPGKPAVSFARAAQLGEQALAGKARGADQQRARSRVKSAQASRTTRARKAAPSRKTAGRK